MITILIRYDGSSDEVNEGVAEVINDFRGEFEAWAFKALKPSDVKAFYTYSWSDPEEMGVALIKGTGLRVIGVSWAYTSSGIGGGLAVSPYVPHYGWLSYEALSSLLSWARFRLELRLQARGRVTIYSWFENSYLHKLVKELLNGSGVTIHSSTLMKFTDSVMDFSAPEGYLIRDGDLEGDDLAGAVKVYNEAFAREYELLREWSVEDARKFYRREGLHLVVAEKPGEGIVGFADGRVFKAVDGGLSGEVMTVGVLRRHRGRGLGKALVSAMVRKLTSLGAPRNRIALTSVAGLEGLYRRLGFREVRRFVKVEAPITSLPPPNQAHYSSL